LLFLFSLSFSSLAFCFSCDHGTQTRRVWCWDDTNSVEVTDVNCGGGKPAATDPCYTACTHNYLSALTVPDAISYTFSKTTQTYSVEVPWDTTSVTATAAAEHYTASYAFQTQTVSGLLWPNAQQIKVTVTAQSGATRVYTVDVLRQRSYNCYLKSLTPNVESLNTLFVKTNYNYEVNLPNAHSSITMSAQYDDALAAGMAWTPSSTVGSLPVLPTKTTIKVVVTAQVSGGETQGVGMRWGRVADSLREPGSLLLSDFPRSTDFFSIAFPSRLFALCFSSVQNTVNKCTYTIVVSRARSSEAKLAQLTVDTMPASTARMFPTFASTRFAYDFSGRIGPAINSVKLGTAVVDSTITSIKYQLTPGGSWVTFSAGVAQTIAIQTGKQQMLTVQVLAEVSGKQQSHTAAGNS
jgi:hypothetical protein